MELQPITVEDKSQARIAIKAYRAAVKERHSKEDEMIVRGYREILRGRRLINLSEAISTAGMKPTGYPKLAIARADMKRCWCRRNQDGSVTFASDSNMLWRSRAARDQRFDFGPNTLPPLASSAWLSNVGAIVPIVPAELRPADDLSNYHVLFEAEWTLVAPRDPALLKHIGGDLWAVLAVWNLTEVERAVIGMTRRP